MVQKKQLTGKTHVARHLGQRRINELLEIHLLILNVEQRLPRPQARLAVPQRPRRIVPVQRLDVERLEREGDVVDGEGGAARGAHEAQRLDDDLADAILDVLGQALEGFLVEGSDADGFGDVFNVFGVPEQFGRVGRHGCWWLMGGWLWEMGVGVLEWKVCDVGAAWLELKLKLNEPHI